MENCEKKQTNKVMLMRKKNYNIETSHISFNNLITNGNKNPMKKPYYYNIYKAMNTTLCYKNMNKPLKNHLVKYGIFKFFKVAFYSFDIGRYRGRHRSLDTSKKFHICEMLSSL